MVPATGGNAAAGGKLATGGPAADAGWTAGSGSRTKPSPFSTGAFAGCSRTMADLICARAGSAVGGGGAAAWRKPPPAAAIGGVSAAGAGAMLGAAIRPMQRKADW